LILDDNPANLELARLAAANNSSLPSELGVLCALAGVYFPLFDSFRFVLANLI